MQQQSYIGEYMKKEATPESVIINSVDRTLDIVLYIYAKARPVRITEIANDLSIYKSTVYRSLQTLKNKGFIEQNQETDTYWLGLKFFMIGSLVRENFKLENILEPYAKILHKEFGEVVNICTLDTTTAGFPKVLTLHMEESSSQVLRANPSIGRLSDCHNSSAGKCLLAFSKTPITKDTPFPLRKCTPHTITDWDEFLCELQKTRELQYATDADEYEIGLTCIGSPILDKNGIAIATLSIAGPTQRMQENREQKIARVIEIAKLASERFM